MTFPRRRDREFYLRVRANRLQMQRGAIRRMFARKHNFWLDSDQEFIALAAANLMAGLG